MCCPRVDVHEKRMTAGLDSRTSIAWQSGMNCVGNSTFRGTSVDVSSYLCVWPMAAVVIMSLAASVV
jgi:hypothetical protein